jgi:hypothetical protein
MGGKSSEAPPAVMPQQNNSMDMMMPMLQAMMQMMQGMAGMMRPPEMPEAPEPETPAQDEPVDWEKKQEELAAKMQADQEAENAKKYGTEDTIHTSPLLDQPEDTRGSILASDEEENSTVLA